TVNAIVPGPGVRAALLSTINPSTTEANPRGPNQPRNRIEGRCRRDRYNANATGAMRINVRINSAYIMTRASMAPSSGTSNIPRYQAETTRPDLTSTSRFAKLD